MPLMRAKGMNNKAINLQIRTLKYLFKFSLGFHKIGYFFVLPLKKRE